MKNIITKALIDSLCAAAYIIAVACFMFYGKNIFGPSETILIPITLLLLFVLSAAVTGSLVLGRSILWYVEGEKKNALVLLFAKLVILLVLFVLVLSISLLA